MKQPYNTALYMRLSRDDENYGDSVSIETQRTILRQFAKENQLHVMDVPIGYKKHSEVKNLLEIDEETRWIVEKV